MRIALAQLNPVVGDVAGNLRRVLDAIGAARDGGADVLVASELVLVGYPPRDLLLRDGVVEACADAVRAVADAAGAMTVIVGHPRRADTGVRGLRNSVSVCRDGRILAVYDKRLLPGYDVFDEDRYFDVGATPCVVDVGGVRLGIIVCEDLWEARDAGVVRAYDASPVGETVDAGAAVIIALNASPFVRGKGRRHLDELVDLARRIECPVISVNQVGANDDLVFDGRSFAVDAAGRPIAALPGWIEAMHVVDLDAPTVVTPPADAFDPDAELFDALVLGVRDYCRKTGHASVALGLSGGIDSAVVAALAVAALGPESVTGLLMPSEFSSTGSVTDANDLVERLGIAAAPTIPLGPALDATRAMLAPHLGARAGGLTEENLQARLRGLLLMAWSNASGGLVLATGNKSELAVGYSTLYGDMCGALSVIGDVLKTDVYRLARWMNAHFARCGFDRPPIPEASITKPPSAELRPDQTDQDSLPAYDVLDAIIRAVVEEERSVESIIARDGLDAGTVRRFARAIDLAEYKRNQAAVILKVSRRTFGPGRPMPLVMRSTSLPAPCRTDDRASG